MGSNVKKFGAVLFVLLLTASAGLAADGDAAAGAGAAAVQPTPEMTGEDSHNIRGFVDVRYVNASDEDPFGLAAHLAENGPLASPVPPGGGFGAPEDHSTFQLAEVEVNFYGTMFGSRADYRVDIEAFGGFTTAGVPASNLIDPAIKIEQANMVWSFEAFGLTHSVTMGLFNASEMIGHERLDAPNMNTVSHSALFTALLPERLTGIIWEPHFSGPFKLKISATNPWDQLLDTTSSTHTFGLSGTYEQQKLQVGLSVLSGREEAGSDEDRLAYDLWAQFDIIQNAQSAIKNLRIVVEATSGQQGVENGAVGGIGDHDWLGWYIEAHADFGGSKHLDRLDATLRFGMIDIESDAGPHVLTGNLLNDGTGTEGSMTEIVAAIGYDLTKKMKLTAEFRMVEGDTTSFLDDDGDNEFDSSSITIQAVVEWP